MIGPGMIPAARKNSLHSGLVESEPGVREPLVEAHTFLSAFGHVVVTTSIVLMGMGEQSESKQSKKN